MSKLYLLLQQSDSQKQESVESSSLLLYGCSSYFVGDVTSISC